MVDNEDMPAWQRDELVAALHAAASPVRLRILELLSQAPRGVQELAHAVGVSQPLVSHHLKVMRAARLVTAERVGRVVVHRPADAPVVRLIQNLIVARVTPGDAMTTTEHAQHTDHEHAHGHACGHVAVPHGDHVDYAHDGHLHREHDGHWDKCEPTEHAPHGDHDHEHGAGCGHVAVPHGDHVDYLHDGHRHAEHSGHYDEH